jgi:hypothetical protein
MKILMASLLAAMLWVMSFGIGDVYMIWDGYKVTIPGWFSYLTKNNYIKINKAYKFDKIIKTSH